MHGHLIGPSNLACPKSLGSLQASHLDSHQREREKTKAQLSWKSSDLLFIGTGECSCANATFISLLSQQPNRRLLLAHIRQIVTAKLSILTYTKTQHLYYCTVILKTGNVRETQKQCKTP